MATSTQPELQKLTQPWSKIFDPDPSLEKDDLIEKVRM